MLDEMLSAEGAACNSKILYSLYYAILYNYTILYSDAFLRPAGAVCNNTILYNTILYYTIQYYTVL